MVAFMDTVATIPTGSMAERWRWQSFVQWALFCGAIYYPLFGAWTWGGGWLNPLFALANAWVLLNASAFDTAGAGTVAVAVGIGLVVGKLVGVTAFTWLAVRLGLGSLPVGVRWPQVVGIAGVAGVGFTVSIFVAGLAFEPGAGLEPAAKIGILAASAMAALVGSSILIALHRGEVRHA